MFVSVTLQGRWNHPIWSVSSLSEYDGTNQSPLRRRRRVLSGPTGFNCDENEKLLIFECDRHNVHPINLQALFEGASLLQTFVCGLFPLKEMSNISLMICVTICLVCLWLLAYKMQITLFYLGKNVCENVATTSAKMVFEWKFMANPKRNPQMSHRHRIYRKCLGKNGTCSIHVANEAVNTSIYVAYRITRANWGCIRAHCLGEWGARASLSAVNKTK